MDFNMAAIGNSLTKSPNSQLFHAHQDSNVTVIFFHLVCLIMCIC